MFFRPSLMRRLLSGTAASGISPIFNGASPGTISADSKTLTSTNQNGYINGYGFSNVKKSSGKWSLAFKLNFYQGSNSEIYITNNTVGGSDPDNEAQIVIYNGDIGYRFYDDDDGSYTSYTKLGTIGNWTKTSTVEMHFNFSPSSGGGTEIYVVCDGVATPTYKAPYAAPFFPVANLYGSQVESVTFVGPVLPTGYSAWPAA